MKIAGVEGRLSSYCPRQDLLDLVDDRWFSLAGLYPATPAGVEAEAATGLECFLLRNDRCGRMSDDSRQEREANALQMAREVLRAMRLQLANVGLRAREPTLHRRGIAGGECSEIEIEILKNERREDILEFSI